MKNNTNLNYFFRTYRISSRSFLDVTHSLDQIIIGSLLGDLCVNKRSNNANSRLQFNQSIKNRVYIDHLYLLFKDYCGSRPMIKSVSLKSQSNKEYQSIRFHTLTLPCFNYYWDLFYKFNGTTYKKIVPKNLYDLLTPVGLAYWIMDDGFKPSGSNGLTLCSESFTLEEHEILLSVLNKKFNLDCTIQKSFKRNRIYIKSNSKDILLNYVEPFVIPHFHYKLNI